MYKRQQLSTLSFCIPSLYRRAKVSLNETVKVFQNSLKAITMSTNATQSLAGDRVTQKGLRFSPINCGFAFNKTILRNQLTIDQ